MVLVVFDGCVESVQPALLTLSGITLTYLWSSTTILHARRRITSSTSFENGLADVQLAIRIQTLVKDAVNVKW